MMLKPTGVMLVVVLMVAMPATLHAQGTDEVQVTNGDRIRGDVSSLERGRLKFGTAAAGTISIIWTEVVRLTSTRTHDVGLASGQRFSGSVSSPSDRQLVIETASGPTRPIDMEEIVDIIPIGAGFRSRTTGSVDFGLSFTNARNTRTYTLDTAALHRSRTHTYETQVSFNSWLSAQDDVERQTRNDLALDVRRRLPQRWFAVAIFEAQQDEQLELDARFIAGGGVGRKLVQSNQALLSVQGGVDYAAERYRSAGAFDHAAEAFGALNWDWFATGNATEVAVSAAAFVSLERQRARLELDATLRRDIFGSMHWALNVFESFDSDPPGDRPRSGFGFAFGLGWSF